MVCAYFGLVNRSPGFFCLAATVGGGGGGGGGGGEVPGAPLCDFKTAHDTATKIAQSILLIFSKI